MNGVGERAPVASRWKVHLRGHLLLFEPRPWPRYSQATGLRLLAVATGLEALRLALVRGLSPLVPLWVLMPLLLGAALVSVPRVAGLALSELGLRRWREWSTTEKSYFLQVMLLASGVLLIGVLAERGSGGGQGELIRSLGGVFLPYLFFGFYQELVYRGLVQTELVRRWGVWQGILAANLLYTFGPLHWNYFGSRGELAVPMFASIFLIGLFFGVLYRRSGNLWIVGCFHAIGNAAIVWRVGSLQ